MAHTSAQYNAESRTVTPQQGGVVTHQAWKRAGTGAASAAGTENRTAAAAVDAGRSFGKVLADDPATHRTRGFEAALSMSEPPAAAAPSSSISFDDFIDIVNPLQHLPLVNLVYRELTGDSIGPIAQIVGGGIYGGPVGAVSGTVNAVVQESTGKDIAGNVLALVEGDDGTYAVPDAAPASIDRDNPEMALSLAAAQYTGDTYLPVPIASAEPPPTAMGFTAMRNAAAAYERTATADGRTAGWTTQVKELPALDVDYTPAKIDLDQLPARDAITVMPMNGPTFGGLY